MDENLDRTTNVIVPTGMLGWGVDRNHIRRGIELGAHAIAVDSGSTDSGPYYLATANSKMNRESIRHDLEILVEEACRANIPLLVGSCGTSGTDRGVDWTCEIVSEVLTAKGLLARIACVYSQQEADIVKRKLEQGKIHSLPPLGPLSVNEIDDCVNIVALMGPEPYIRALQEGADIVLGGRTTDAGLLAAVPLMRGAGTAPSWHAGKIAECGGLCTEEPGLGGVLIRVGVESFVIEPLNPRNRCTVSSVSAHMLYENADPFQISEPGGLLDATNSFYHALDERRVQVGGSIWYDKSYTMKLEGARSGDFQTLLMMGIEDPEILSRPQHFQNRLQVALSKRIQEVFADELGWFDLSIRLYGWNGVSGTPVLNLTQLPRELGVLLVVTARTQEEANRIAKTCNPVFLHMPIEDKAELPSHAFPFSPAEIPRGQVYEFVLNHIVDIDDPSEMVRCHWVSRTKETRSTSV